MKKIFALLLVAVMLVGSVEALAGTDKMPTNLTNIEDEAFYGTNLEEVEIPENVNHVGQNAFGNSSVRSVVFQGSPEIIEEDAFPAGAVGYAAAGTVAAEYFKNTEGLSYVNNDPSYQKPPVFDVAGAFIASLSCDDFPYLNLRVPLSSWDEKATDVIIADKETESMFWGPIDGSSGTVMSASERPCAPIQVRVPAYGTSVWLDCVGVTVKKVNNESVLSDRVPFSLTISSMSMQPTITKLCFPGEIDKDGDFSDYAWIIVKNLDPDAAVWLCEDSSCWPAFREYYDFVMEELDLNTNIYSAIPIVPYADSSRKRGQNFFIVECSGLSASSSQKLVVDWSAKTYTLEDSEPIVLKYVDENNHNQVIENGSVTDYNPENGNLKVSWTCDGADHFIVRAILLDEEPANKSQKAKVTLKDSSDYTETSIEFTSEQLSAASYLKIAVKGVDSAGNVSNYPWIGFRIVKNEPSDVIERLIQIALAEEGEGEDSSGETKYGIWAGDSSGNWCAYFIAWCAAQANAGEYLSPSAANANSMSFGIPAANSVYFDQAYEDWSYNNTAFPGFLKQCRLKDRSDYIPQKGELIYFLGGSSGKSPFGHVGLVYADCKDNTVYYIDGNGTGNKVTKRTVDLDSTRICGYGDAFASLRQNSEAAIPGLTLRKSETHISGRNDESEKLEVWYRSDASKVTLQMKDASGSGVPIRPDWMSEPTDGSPVETDISQGGLYYRIPMGTPSGMYTMELVATNSSGGETKVTYPFSVRTTVRSVNLSRDQALSEKFSELEQALPDGQYWNVAGETYDVDVVTGFGETLSVTLSDQPCPSDHHSMEHTPKNDSMFFTCNHEGTSDDRAQCAGWVRIIGRIIGGRAFNPRKYGINDPNETDNLEPGDIIRSDDQYHSILVTGVRDDGMIEYTDCNASGGCKIRWGAVMTKEAARSMVANNGYVCKYSDYSNASSTGPDVAHVAAPSSWLRGRFSYLESMMPTGKGWWYDPSDTALGVIHGYPHNEKDQAIDVSFKEVTLTGGAADFITVIASAPHFYTGYKETCGQYFDPGKYDGGIATYIQHIDTGSPGHLSAQCMGFTDMLGYYLTGKNRPYNAWTRIEIENETEKLSAIKELKPGDIICIDIGGWELGHKMMITNVNNDGITYVEANGENHCGINWESTYSWDQLKAYSSTKWKYVNKYPGDPD